MPNKYGNYKWLIEYSFNKTTKRFLSDASSYPEAYKSFWAMVKTNRLWTKSRTPIHIINNWSIENDFLVPHTLSNYTDKELGIMNTNQASL